MTASKHFDPWSILLRRAVQPLYYRRHGDRRFHRLRELERNQWLPSADLKRLQLERLNALIRHAHATTEFWRERLDAAGIGAGPLTSLAGLAALEPISKATLQRHGESMVSRAYAKDDLVRDASGGSTGTPTILYKDRDRHNLRRADQYRHDRWSGWDIGDPWALVWGARQDLADSRSPRERLVERWVHRCMSLDAFELTDKKMRAYLARLADFRPRMVLGYANALGKLADFMLDSGLERSVRPAGIISSAETLGRRTRERIERAFGCKVLDRYGSREVGLIASECGQGPGLHVNADNLFVEVLDAGRPAKPGEAGDVVVTDLWNYGMPLLRYNMQDRAVGSARECRCGRGLPMLESVEGRESDFLTAADGTRIHGEFFTHLFYDEPSIAQFQVVQETMQRTIIRIVPAGTVDDRSLQAIAARTRDILGGRTDVAVEHCEAIPATPSGKFRFTISKVPA